MPTVHTQTITKLDCQQTQTILKLGNRPQARYHRLTSVTSVRIVEYQFHAQREHWADDYEAHLEICDTLREINEDDHDLRSGRFFPEFEYPGDQIEEAMVNMTNWDTLLFSREFKAINDERSLRQATRLLTYPLTIGVYSMN
ncbi:hypothetical protein DID88_005201 [Monilinia fructigena]|uniref:Mitochondrial splicing suppressor 51 zinc-finger domain-containing protein n=1 Tax=Monilinia fructigena TaxID=38457 RepID=A0A395IDP4_9HELO|nr:hypothetical protein DID88_005201 [Monilinia fructigena]